jgi:hypothetical protein
VGRFASALAFLFTLTVVLAAAGCGQRFDDLGTGQPPTQAELASEALTALESAGSAHVVADATGGSISGTNAKVGIHFEGDVSASALAGDGEVRFPGGTVGARLLIDEHDAYVRFMGQWYHAGSGFADALADAKANPNQEELLRKLTTPVELGKLFAELFEGKVAEGPVVDGVATWQFDGHFQAKAFADLVEKYAPEKLTTNDRALLERVAATSHLLVVVGQEDHLPRKLELSLDPPKDLHFDSQALQSSDDAFSITVELSDFGTDVSFSAPKDAKPLDALFDQFFSGMG